MTDDKGTTTSSSSPTIAHDLTPIKLASTAIASVFAAIITYPIEKFRVEWEEVSLKYWNPELEHVVISNRFRVLTPLIRLTLNEISGNLLTMATINSANNGMTNDTIQFHVFSGCIAGVSQACLLSPLEAWRANQTMYKELQLSQKFTYWLYSQVFRGGSIDPGERRRRAFRGVVLTAVREVVFNVTFFPIFHILRLQTGNNTKNYFVQSGNTSYGDETMISLITNGIIAGSICSVAVTPLDIIRSYMMNSRERYSLWSGRRIHSVPISFLKRGLLLQAFCYGD